MTASGRLAFSLLVMLAAVLPASMLSAQPPNTDLPDLRPTLSVFKPAKDDEGLREHAAVGEVVEAPVKSAGLRGTFATLRSREGTSLRSTSASPEAAGDYEITLERKGDSPPDNLKGTVPFSSRIEVTYSLTWKGKPDALIAAHGIRIPFAFGPNPRRAKVVVGAPGRPRGETWWVDPNDMWHIYWMLSDQKERWPLWRLGGITQESPDRFVIWKANRADTVPLVVDEGRESPGWLDVSDTDHGLTVIWDEMPKRAPCALEVDWSARTIEVWFHPPSAAPQTAESLGYAATQKRPVTWKFSLAYHDDAFPRAEKQKQELSRAVYAELLRLVDEQKLWQHVAMNYLVPVAGDLDARIRQAIDTGIQPSELLRYFDTGDASKMQKLCDPDEIGTRRSNDHAANVKAVLDYCAQKAKKR